jgi:hypothetical protein
MLIFCLQSGAGVPTFTIGLFASCEFPELGEKTKQHAETANHFFILILPLSKYLIGATTPTITFTYRDAPKIKQVSFPFTLRRSGG